MVVGYHHFWKHPYIYIYSIYLYRTRWYWSGTYFRVELTSYDLADGETPVFLWFVWCFSMRNLHIATIDVMGAYWMRSCFVWQIPPQKNSGMNQFPTSSDSNNSSSQLKIPQVQVSSLICHPSYLGDVSQLQSAQVHLKSFQKHVSTWKMQRLRFADGALHVDAGGGCSDFYFSG